jgi:hypothetical protein
MSRIPILMAAILGSGVLNLQRVEETPEVREEFDPFAESKKRIAEDKRQRKLAKRRRARLEPKPESAPQEKQ